MEFRTVQDMSAAIQRNLSRVPASTRLVVGASPGGLVAASLLARYLNLPCTDIEGFLQGGWFTANSMRHENLGDHGRLERGADIVVVDDCLSESTGIENVRRRLLALGNQCSITYVTIYALPEYQDRVDLVFDVASEPAVFEWSIFHDALLADTCVDIDGVLCVDPTPSENDDGERYAEFLAKASPLMRPSATIGTLVTSRLEHYRPLTEAWLQDHGIAYNRLIMMDYATANERSRANRQAHFKAKAYRDTGALLFIESSPILAHHIAQLAKKPVLEYGRGELALPRLSGMVQVRAQRLAWHYRRVRRSPRKLGRIGLRHVRARYRKLSRPDG